MNNKGYTLLEFVLTLMIITSLSTIVIREIKKPRIDYIYFMNDYIKAQTEAISKREEKNFENDYSDIFFNKDGKVNQAKTIEIDNHDIVIHLGTGYATIE